MEQTFGEKIVRVDFNVTGNSKVDSIKKKTAELINEICEMRDGDKKDGRLASLAITHFETAAMFAVKCATS